MPTGDAAGRELRLWLVRHGATEANAVRRVQGRADVPLNEEGRRQARAVGGRLAGAGLRAIYSSPLARAAETARIVGAALHLPVTLVEELREVEMGAWEGRTVVELLGQDVAGRWMFGPGRALLGEVEGVGEIVARARRAVARAGRAHPAGDVCLVGHSGILAGVLAACLGLAGGVAFPPVLLGNASISLLVRRLDRWLLAFANDQHHLGPPPARGDDLMQLLFGAPETPGGSKPAYTPRR